MTRFNEVTVTIDEGQRQMLLLALAKLSLDRPGWHWTLGELAAKFSTVIGQPMETLTGQWYVLRAIERFEIERRDQG